jgi:hypothetical protein
VFFTGEEVDAGARRAAEPSGIVEGCGDRERSNWADAGALMTAGPCGCGAHLGVQGPDPLQDPASRRDQRLEDRAQLRCDGELDTRINARFSRDALCLVSPCPAWRRFRPPRPDDWVVLRAIRKRPV